MNSLPSPVSSSLKTHLAFIIQNFDGLAHLVLTDLQPSMDAAECLMKIRLEYKVALCKVRRSHWRSMFTKYIIGTGQVQLVIAAESETPTQSSYPTVILRDFSPSELLRHGWHNSVPLMLSKSPQMISDENLLISLSTPEDIPGKRAIVVRQVLSKMKVAAMLLGLLGFGSVLGVIVGIFTGRADMAVAIAAGSFACVTVLQSLVVWLAN